MDPVSILLGGFASGMVLFIVSVGLSVTMGLMGFVNLAHGGFAMLGGYAIVLAMRHWGLDFFTSLALAFAGVALLSVLLEKLFYAKLYRAPELDQVLFTIGLVFVMTAAVTLGVGFIQYRTYSLALIVTGTSLMLVLWLGFERTRFGARIRAAVDNRRMAASLGVDVGRLFTVTFAIGSGLAAAGGGLGAEILGLDPNYPLRYLVYFLIVVAVGGLGRVTGVFFAALLIGVLDFVFKVYFPQGGTIFIYALTLVLLLWRPQGLFGKKGA